MLALGAALAVAVAAHADEAPVGGPPTAIDGQPATSKQVSGQRVYIDPSTGRIGAPPPGAAAPEGSGAAEAAPVEPLVQEAAPAGGVMVDLKGRFRSEVRAHTLPDGRVVTECVPTGPHP